MELEGPQEPQEPQEPVAETPPIDPNVAVQVAAQHFGVDPSVLVDSLRLQEENRRVYEENRRTRRELEIERAKIDAVQQATRRYEPPPSYDDVDPVSRRILERLDKSDERWSNWERQQQEKEQHQAMIQEQGAILHSEYENLMRQVPTQSRMETQEFFGRMAELYPTGVPDGLSPAQAVNNTARYLGIQSNGVAPSSYAAPRIAPSRDPRQQIVIPAGQNGTPPDQQAGDQPPQIRAGEPQEQFDARARVWWENKFGGKRHQQIMRDGAKFSSG